jgi:hypothetical protein
MSWRTKRRRRESPERAEERSFTSIYERRPKNRPTQLLMSLAILFVFAGAGFSVGGAWFGPPLVLVGFVALGGLFWRALRTWDV